MREMKAVVADVGVRKLYVLNLGSNRNYYYYMEIQGDCGRFSTFTAIGENPMFSITLYGIIMSDCLSCNNLDLSGS